MFQQIIIIGRLGRDPEMRFTPNGQATATFSVATDHTYRDQADEVKKITTWFNVTVWGKMAENCNTYLRKGKLVMVQGRLTPDAKTGGPRLWAGKDGAERASYEVSASMVKFLSPSEHSAVEAEPAADGGEDIPF